MHKELTWKSHFKQPWALSLILGVGPWIILFAGLLILAGLARSGDEVAWAQDFGIVFLVCSLAGGVLAIFFARQAKRTAQDKMHRILSQIGWILGILDVTLLLLCSWNVPNNARMSRHEKEEQVKAVAYQVEMAIREFQQSHAGMKPNVLSVLEAMMSDSVKAIHNPFIPRQSYNLYTGGLVDRVPVGPGQIGYLYQGQNKPYKVIANGWRKPVLVLEEIQK
jgi:hypothetical protein